MKDNLNEIMVRHTSQSLDKIAQDTDRDFIMDAEQARKYGIIDQVITKRE